MKPSSLPTAIAATTAPQLFAARSFVRGSWARDGMAANASAFGLSGLGKPATGHRPYRTSNPTIA